jgi:hypothetical protein
MVDNHKRGKASQPWHQAPNNSKGETKCDLDTVNKSRELYGARCIAILPKVFHGQLHIQNIHEQHTGKAWNKETIKKPQ